MPKKSVKDTPEIQWITSDRSLSDAFITVDSQLRLYFSRATLNMLGNVKEIQVGYDLANRRMIVANPKVVRPANVRPHKVDERGYASARPFIRAVGLDRKDLPLRYAYLGKDYSVRGAYVFGLDGEAGEDGQL